MVLYRCVGVEVHGLVFRCFRSVAFGSAFLLSFGRFWAGCWVWRPSTCTSSSSSSSSSWSSLIPSLVEQRSLTSRKAQKESTTTTRNHKTETQQSPAYRFRNTTILALTPAFSRYGLLSVDKISSSPAFCNRSHSASYPWLSQISSSTVDTTSPPDFTIRMNSVMAGTGPTCPCVSVPTQVIMS